MFQTSNSENNSQNFICELKKDYQRRRQKEYSVSPKMIQNLQQDGISLEMIFLGVKAITRLLEKIWENMKQGNHSEAASISKVVLKCLQDFPKDKKGRLPTTIFQLVMLIIINASREEANRGYIKSLNAFLVEDLKRSQKASLPISQVKSNTER